VNKIFVFSGTGNSLKCAYLLQEQLQETEIVLITSKNIVSQIECDTFILIFPIYAYDVPSIIEEFLKKSIIKAKYISVLVTYGSTCGPTYQIIKRLLPLNYFNKIKSIENFQSIFPFPKEKKINKIKKETQIKINSIALDIKEEKKFHIKSFYFLTFIPRHLYNLFKKTKLFTNKTNKKCTLCGLCQRICPVQAIQQKDKVVFDNKKCLHCQRCVAYCPLKAINFLLVTNKTKRYHNLEIEIKDF
jgi:ferredoxin